MLITMAGDLGRVRLARADEPAVAVEQRAREVVGPAIAELEREAVEAERLAARAVREQAEEARVRAGGFAVDPAEDWLVGVRERGRKQKGELVVSDGADHERRCCGM